MTKTPSVCIILATFNGSTYLPAQLKSFKDQTFSNWQLFVSDDGSTDDTLKILTDFKKSTPQKVTIQKNPGPLHGTMANFTSALVAAPKADYYMFSDQDDVWLPQKIEKLLQLIQKTEVNSPDIPVLAYCDLKIVDQNLNTLYDSMLESNHLHLNLKHPLNSLLVDNYIPGCAMIFNHALRQQLDRPYIKEGSMHDWWIALVAATTGKIVKLNQPLNLYRQHSNNVLGAEQPGTTFSSHLKTHLTQVSKIFHLATYQNWKTIQDLRVSQAKELLHRYGNLQTQNIKTIRLFLDISAQKNPFTRLYGFIKNHFQPIHATHVLKMLAGGPHE